MHYGTFRFHALRWTLALAAFIAFAGIGFAQPWEGDGGHSGDYSNIPRLQHMGTERPGTHAEYMAGRPALPFQASQVMSGKANRAAGRATKALVLVNSTLYPNILTSLNTYVADLAAAGYTVEVYQISGGTDVDLKIFIQNHATDLAGCVFVGDLPVAWQELEVWGHEEFPIDLYFMDLDGTWTDTDGDGMWNDHTAGAGDVGPEIFIGHIDTSMMTGNEAALTNTYFAKNHAYRTGQISVPGHALSYTEDDWASFMDMRTDIKYAYPSFDDIPAPATEKSDYQYNRLPSTAYEFIQICCHSSQFAHYFTRGGQLWNTQVQAVNPYAIFYNLFCCSTLRFTDIDFLGRAYIYDTSDRSLAVIGSTKTGSMLEFAGFYQPFGNLESFGEAFRQWFNYIAPYNDEEKAWHYGMTIAGDPFLTLIESPLHVTFPEGLPGAGDSLPPGPVTRILLDIQSGAENYVPGSGLFHYRFKGSDPFSTASLTSVGGSQYEAILPGTRPGDTPQFYFSLEGDGGATVLLPPDAPGETYAFEVLLKEYVMRDDFETDLGWTVQNTNVQKGAWERGDPASSDAQPEDDHSALGTQCFVTGPLGGSIGDHDLDGGPTQLFSPALDLSSGDAFVEFFLYFYHSDYGVQQRLEVAITDGVGGPWKTVMNLTHKPAWEKIAFKVSDHVTPTAQVQLRISAIDDPNDDVVEALVDDFGLVRYIDDPSLWADGYSFSASSGAYLNFSLDAGTANAGKQYLLLGSSSGTWPGLTLPGGVNLPLNWDLLSDTLVKYVFTPYLQNFLGTLDSQGESTATLDTNGSVDPALAGTRLYFAYFTVIKPHFASNPVEIQITD